MKKINSVLFQAHFITELPFSQIQCYFIVIDLQEKDLWLISCCMTLGKIGLNVWKDISGIDSD